MTEKLAPHQSTQNNQSNENCQNKQENIEVIVENPRIIETIAYILNKQAEKFELNKQQQLNDNNNEQQQNKQQNQNSESEKKLMSEQKEGSSFQSENIPKITLEKYMERIKKFAIINENYYFITALIYLERIVAKNQSNIQLTPFTVHRLLFVAVLTAIKFSNDNNYQNVYYAKVGGIKLQDLNKMEVEFLDLIEYNLLVSEEEYSQEQNKLNLFSENL